MPPSITQQPTAINTRCEGQSVTFSVTAAGAGLTYHGGRTECLSSERHPRPTRSPRDPLSMRASTRWCRCTCQPTPMISANAQLVVNTLPASRQSALAGDRPYRPVTFSVDATGTESPPVEAHGAVIAGATGSSYTIHSGRDRGAGNYDVVVTESARHRGRAPWPCLPSTRAGTLQVGPSRRWYSRTSGYPEHQRNRNAAQLPVGTREEPDSGATSSTYIIPSVQTIDAGLYSVPGGSNSVRASETSGGHLRLCPAKEPGLTATRKTRRSAPARCPLRRTG